LTLNLLTVGLRLCAVPYLIFIPSAFFFFLATCLLDVRILFNRFPPAAPTGWWLTLAVFAAVALAGRGPHLAGVLRLIRASPRPTRVPSTPVPPDAQSLSHLRRLSIAVERAAPTLELSLAILLLALQCIPVPYCVWRIGVGPQHPHRLPEALALTFAALLALAWAVLLAAIAHLLASVERTHALPAQKTDKRPAQALAGSIGGALTLNLLTALTALTIAERSSRLRRHLRSEPSMIPRSPYRPLANPLADLPPDLPNTPAPSAPLPSP
jgi:hypothetical protein